MNRQRKAKLTKRLRNKERKAIGRMTERIRAAPAVEGMVYRSSMLEAPNEQARTVVTTLSTEQPVPMFDYRTRGVIDEVLVASGGTFPAQMPMLDDHSRWGANSVLGSIRNPINSGDRWRGTLHFATNAGEQVDQIWEKVRQGHITDVSVGYRYGEGDYTDIPAGQTRSVNGRSYTAGRSRIMRIVTSWTAREGSITPIGADDQAKIGRSGGIGSPGALGFSFEIGAGEFQSGHRTEDDMKKYLEFLHARGMGSDITEQVAALEWARRNLAGDLLAQFADICRSDSIEFKLEQTQTRAAAAPVAPTPTAPVAGGDQQRSAADLFAEARERAAFVNQVGDGVPAEVRQRAISESWDIPRINTEFATARQQRSAPLSGQAPAGHVVNRTLTARSLQAAMLLRSGVQIDNEMFRSSQAQHVLGDRSLFRMGNGLEARERGDWMVNYSRSLQRGGSTQDDLAARAVEQAHQLQRMSMIDICSAALDIEGVSYDRYDRDEIIHRSFSTATLNAVFTTNFAAQMLVGFMDAPDTTVPWTAEAELPNFQTVERFQMQKTGKMKRTDRNQTPGDQEAQAVLESYKLHRYADRFVVDEMDIIDDRFGAIDMTVPREMGEAARVIRPDLVYSILLGNPTMGQDSTALFHADHGNYTASGAALASATLSTAKSAMASQTSNGRLLDIRGQYLIVAETKDWTARQLIGSSEVRDTNSSTLYGTMNPAKGQFAVISDPRLDVGVTDPSSLTGVTNAGEPGSWFLATAKGKHGIEVGHLRGTGRAPVVRRFELTEGRLGIGWLCVMYNAAKAVGFQGLSKQKA